MHCDLHVFQRPFKSFLVIIHYGRRFLKDRTALVGSSFVRLSEHHCVPFWHRTGLTQFGYHFVVVGFFCILFSIAVSWAIGFFIGMGMVRRIVKAHHLLDFRESFSMFFIYLLVLCFKEIHHTLPYICKRCLRSYLDRDLG